MNFDEIKIIEKPLEPTDPKEVKSLEEDLWIKFPQGYLEYITRFGEGVLANEIRIYPPYRIKNELTQWRERIKNYWFWGAEPNLLPKERALESIIIGDTLNGDEIVFHPNRPDKIFMLPHESDTSTFAGSNLFEVIEEIFIVIENEYDEFEFTFKPFASRNFDNNFYYEDEVQDPTGESIEEIVKLGQEWEIRHSARKQAKESLKKQITSIMKSEIIKEGICTKTGKGDIGYFIEFLIKNAECGSKVGVFKFHKNSQSSGTSWKPNSANYPL